MMSKNNGGPAFPTISRSDDGEVIRVEGMTLRDYFAAKAMYAFVHRSNLIEEADTSAEWLKTIADASYEMADAMLKAREQ